ncbi:MAG: sigma 54-interacting transcriptional regulator [Deltaproteobacteria bacterium]
MKKRTPPAHGVPNVRAMASVKDSSASSCVCDDTERQSIDQAACQNAQLMEAIFDSIPGLLYLYTEGGRLIRWNKQHEFLTGYTAAELMNFKSENWFDEKDRITLAEEWPKIFAEGRHTTELDLVLKNGSKVPYLFSASRVMLDGKLHAVGIGIDLSELKQKEAALRKSTNILKKTEEAAHIGTWQLDIKNKEYTWSEESYRIFGIEKGRSLTYDLFLSRIHPDDRSMVDAAWQAALKKAPYDIDHRIIVDGKIRWIRERATVYYNQFDEPDEAIGVAYDITDRKVAEEEKIKAFEEIKRLKELLEAENIYLKRKIGDLDEDNKIIGQSDAIQYVLYRAKQVAKTDTTVFISGPTGAGKGRIARLIHNQSHRKDYPFLVVNCAALPGNLIESELFGREKGAFTGSWSRQIGRFELANKGTIFLDEIGEMPVELQPKLLRVIEDGEFERLGSPHTVKVDARIIVSTNRKLKDEIAKGRFREDLLYRINIFPITVPSLSERKEDIPLLAEHFLEKYKKRFGKNFSGFSEEMMQVLTSRKWPGNVRELMAFIESAAISCKGETLSVCDPYLDEEGTTATPAAKELTETTSNIRKAEETFRSRKSLAEVERVHILQILEDARWKIEGKNGAASVLGLKPSTLRARMKKLGIKRAENV